MSAIDRFAIVQVSVIFHSINSVSVWLITVVAVVDAADD
uniref:7TM GPCR serpentine receptor class x (Srx) domain-containing protein n=1 Tax=Syphacia muris TaxID=451379 RepID=A0A0N5AVY1_9BILA